MVAVNKNISFDYRLNSVSDFRVESSRDKTGRRQVDQVFLGDEPVEATDRFWNSLYARFGISGSIFNYFSYGEVFDRLSETRKDERVRLCVEQNSNTGTNRLMAVSNPSKPVVRYDDLIETLGAYAGESVSYIDGVVLSNHSPRVGSNTFNISGDEFSNRFVLSCPIDGYGSPSIFLALLRLVCSNGMFGYSPAFRSSLAVGRGDENVQFAITRALDGFGSDEGYAALRQRFEAATKSWASVQEAMSFYKLLLKLVTKNQLNSNASLETAGADQFGHPLLNAFHKLTGDVHEIYGIANVDALSAKRQRTLPVNCSVYDILNFSSELATHHLKPLGARCVQAWIGSLITREYDLEGSIDSFEDFQDFFVSRRLNGEVALDIQRLN